MPIIQEGQTLPGNQLVPDLQGPAQLSEGKLFREKCMELWKPQDYVTIKNISTRNLIWQYLPPDSEEKFADSTGMMYETVRGEAEQWYIPAGETDVIVGSSAYLAMDNLYKIIAADTTLAQFNNPDSPLFHSEQKNLPKNFNFSDGGIQDRVIKEAYLGKATPVFDITQAAAPATPVAPAVPQVEPVRTWPEPLNESAPKRAGRPAANKA